MADWEGVLERLRELGIQVAGRPRVEPVRGGDISAAWRVTTETGAIFLKTGAAAAFPRLDAEADGLRALDQAVALRVPRVLACGERGGTAFLALEWLTLRRPDEATARLLGSGLARQHRQLGKEFGWHRDNTIGRTPQINTRDDDWIRFFRQQRLGFQLELARANGYGSELQQEGARLAKRIGRFFEGYEPEPSLLHGDLWGGNWAADDGHPVVFDPAVHYGDRESDIAMTRLFGGFGQAFYDAYEQAWPLPAGHGRRLLLYQLYHVLNHLNLFGSAYHGRALDLLRELNDAGR
jgi:protein-ribulosamine 3-kinase